MTSEAANDWSDLRASEEVHANNVRRADADHPLDFFIGCDFSGRYLLSLTADFGPDPLPEKPELSGIAVALEHFKDTRKRLLLTLEDRDQFDIFNALCKHLMSSTRNFSRGENERGLRYVIVRLRDWHDLLKKSRVQLLSVPEQIGLTGELIFLRDIVLSHMSSPEDILSWRGAHREEQDFSLNGWLVELKTQLSTSDRRLRVSSEAQLDDQTGMLILCHQTIAVAAQNSPASFSLNSLVSSIGERLKDRPLSSQRAFESALEAWGYLPRDEYNDPTWIFVTRTTYEVGPDFPKLTPRNLPRGVSNISYDIDLDACSRFLIPTDTVIRRIFP